VLNITTTDCQIIDVHKELDEWSRERGYGRLDDAVEAIQGQAERQRLENMRLPTPPYPLHRHL